MKNLIRRIAGLIYYPWFSSYEVSVLILSWNRSHLTVKCLQQMSASQSVAKMQIIVIDNGSKPEELKFLKHAISKLKTSVELTTLSNNEGGKAFLRALARVRGKYVLFCENDLVFEPGWFESMKAVFQAHPYLGQLSPLSAIPNSGQGEVWTTKDYEEVSSQQISFLRTRTNVGTTSLVPMKVLRRGIFWKNLHSEPGSSFRFPDDGGFSSQIRRCGFEIGWMETPVAHNLGHTESEWASNPEYYQENWKAKKTMGIDTSKNSLTDSGFELQKLRQENESLKSRLKKLQRENPELFARHEFIQETARVYIDQGSGFRAECFEEFQYHLGIKEEISIDLSAYSATAIRIDCVGFSAQVELDAIQMQGDGAKCEWTLAKLENEFPQVLISSKAGKLKKVHFSIYVQADAK